MRNRLIQVYEWQKLNLGHNGFAPKHLKALLKLNELHGFNYLEATVNGVKFRNYVGVIQVDNLTIEILPKADFGSEHTQWRDLLIKMLIVSKKVKAYDKDYASVGKKRFHLFEIYMDMFLNELEGTIRKGLFKEYRLETSNITALKGKLEMAKHLSINLVHKERFYTRHQTYDSDTLIHQIIKKALSIVQSMASQEYLLSKANRLNLLFPDLKTNHISVNSFKRVVLTRKTRPYTKVLELSKVIIENYSPQISSGKNKMLALLFNMDHLWEEYIYQTLKKWQSEYDYTIHRESKSLFVSDSYFLKPDIILKKDGKNYVLDAKWKQPKDNRASQQDLRQVYTYCRYWDSQRGSLIYPGLAQETSNIFADPENIIACKFLYINKEDIKSRKADLSLFILEHLTK